MATITSSLLCIVAGIKILSIFDNPIRILLHYSTCDNGVYTLDYRLSPHPVPLYLWPLIKISDLLMLILINCYNNDHFSVSAERNIIETINDNSD